jgi:chorismate mutase
MDSPEQQLEQFRARIDALDEHLARLFIERIGIIREVAALKATHWPRACHIRPGREGRMHAAIAKRFQGTGFSPRMGVAIWRQLIGGSTQVESPLRVSYLAQYPEHHFLAREYFGVQVGAQKAASLVEALAALKENRSNILVLPSPEKSDWWRDIKTLQGAGLFIFATLPVIAGNAPEGTTEAVALAAVTPEDSGDDISYFLTAEGALRVLDGFHITLEGAAFLGAHPRAISCNEGVMYA